MKKSLLFYFILLPSVALIADGLYWVARIYPLTGQGIYEMFTGYVPKGSNPDQFLVGFPLGPVVLPILPISIVILGGFLLALDMKNPKLAIPLWFMGCGAFDIIGDLNLLGRIAGGDFWVVFQLGLMFAGWALAGLPKFSANYWLAGVIAVFVLTVGPSGDGRPFEIALFAYIISSTVPNLWGKKAK